jgi:hypothetical protein
MELNHQIRFCRPFPFRFGFRALLRSSYLLKKKVIDLSGKNDTFFRPK